MEPWAPAGSVSGQHIGTVPIVNEAPAASLQPSGAHRCQTSIVKLTLLTIRVLKPPELLILTVLAAGHRHGYGIRQDILELTGGDVEIEAGNLYRHVRALEDDGLVTEAVSPRGEPDERRIYYRLTPAGRNRLAEEMRRLRDLVRAAERNGILTPAGVRA